MTTVAKKQNQLPQEQPIANVSKEQGDDDDDDATSVESGDSIDSQELRDNVMISRRYRPSDGGNTSAYGLAYEKKPGAKTAKGRQGELVVDFAEYSKQRAKEELKHAVKGESSPQGKPAKKEVVPESMKNMYKLRPNRGVVAPLNLAAKPVETPAAANATRKAEEEEKQRFLRSYSDPLDMHTLTAPSHRGKSPSREKVEVTSSEANAKELPPSASKSAPLPVPEDEYETMLQLLASEPWDARRTKTSQPTLDESDVPSRSVDSDDNDKRSTTYLTEFAQKVSEKNADSTKDPVAFYGVIKERQRIEREKDQRYYAAVSALEGLVADDTFARRLTAYLERYRHEFQRTTVNRQRQEYSVREHFIWKTYAQAMETQVMGYLQKQVGPDFDAEEFFERLLSESEPSGPEREEMDEVVAKKAVARSKIELSTDGWQLLLSMLKFEAFNDMMDEYIFTFNNMVSTNRKAAAPAASSKDTPPTPPIGRDTPPAQKLSSTGTSPKPTPPRAPLSEKTSAAAASKAVRPLRTTGKR